MKVCSFIFWSLIVPIVTFASELWVLKDNDVRLLEDFQRYAGKRVQRFPYFTPNETFYTGLGWMRLENFIAAKKLIFVRTIAIMDDLSPVKRVFALRCNAFIGDIDKGIRNDFDSPSFNILKMALCFNILEEVIRMVNGHVVYSKTQ